MKDIKSGESICKMEGYWSTWSGWPSNGQIDMKPGTYRITFATNDGSIPGPLITINGIQWQIVDTLFSLRSSQSVLIPSYSGNVIVEYTPAVITDGLTLGAFVSGSSITAIELIPYIPACQWFRAYQSSGGAIYTAYDSGIFPVQINCLPGVGLNMLARVTI